MNYFLETFESNNFCQHIFYDNLNPLKNTQIFYYESKDPKKSKKIFNRKAESRSIKKSLFQNDINKYYFTLEVDQ